MSCALAVKLSTLFNADCTSIQLFKRGHEALLGLKSVRVH